MASSSSVSSATDLRRRRAACAILSFRPTSRPTATGSDCRRGRSPPSPAPRPLNAGIGPARYAARARASSPPPFSPPRSPPRSPACSLAPAASGEGGAHGSRNERPPGGEMASIPRPASGERLAAAPPARAERSPPRSPPRRPGDPTPPGLHGHGSRKRCLYARAARNRPVRRQRRRAFQARGCGAHEFRVGLLRAPPPRRCSAWR